MANKTISDLLEKTTVADSDVIWVQNASTDNKVTKANLLKEVNDNLNLKANTTHTHTKSQITDFPLTVDNLTSTSSSSNLSANQGKVLDDKITILNGKIGDSTSGLTKNVADNTANIAQNTSALEDIETRVESLELGGGGGITFRDVVDGEIFEISTAPTPTVNVTGVTLNKSTTTVNVGSTDTLVATIVPSNATNKSVTWTSSNNSVATVNNGVVSGVANGTCTITCTTVDGGFTATCSATVQTATISVSSVSLNKSTTTIVNGSTEQLTATVLPSNATNKNVTWSSSNTSIATVSASGLVTGVGIGSATITVTTADGNKTSSCSVTISSSSIAVTSIALNKSTSTLTVPNTEQLTVTFTPSNATNQNVTWTSSDNTKATVSASGLVTSVASGNVTITATSQDGNKTATCNLTIQAIELPSPNSAQAYKEGDYIYINPISFLDNDFVIRDEATDTNHVYFGMQFAVNLVNKTTRVNLFNNFIEDKGIQALTSFLSNTIQCQPYSYIVYSSTPYSRVPKVDYINNNNSIQNTLATKFVRLPIKYESDLKEVIITDEIIDGITGVSAVGETDTYYFGFLNLASELTVTPPVTGISSLSGRFSNTETVETLNGKEIFYINATTRLNYKIPKTKISANTVGELKAYLKQNRLIFWWI